MAKKNKKEKDLEILDEQIKAREEGEQAAENIDSVLEPLEGETRYVEQSPQLTGFPSTEVQHEQYNIITNIISPSFSVLDFGCGRGDYYGWHEGRFGKGKLNYIGVDANKILIEAGSALYDDIMLLNQDWTQLADNIKSEWCININSNNLRYDLTTKSDSEYLFETIETMYKHAKIGVIITLASSLHNEETGTIKHNPGDILNWAQTKFGLVALDHSGSNKEFILIIYKNNQDGKN